jgi:hypothetical protein
LFYEVEGGDGLGRMLKAIWRGKEVRILTISLMSVTTKSELGMRE